MPLSPPGQAAPSFLRWQAAFFASCPEAASNSEYMEYGGDGGEHATATCCEWPLPGQSISE